MSNSNSSAAIEQNGLLAAVPVGTYDDWKKELIVITAKETGKEEWEIKINDDAAYGWFLDGISPYFCFRENWQSDGD